MWKGGAYLFLVCHDALLSPFMSHDTHYTSEIISTHHHSCFGDRLTYQSLNLWWTSFIMVCWLVKFQFFIRFACFYTSFPYTISALYTDIRYKYNQTWENTYAWDTGTPGPWLAGRKSTETPWQRTRMWNIMYSLLCLDAMTVLLLVVGYSISILVQYQTLLP